MVSDPILSRVSFFRVEPGYGYTFESQFTIGDGAPVVDLTFDPQENAIYGFRERDNLISQYAQDGSFVRDFFGMKEEHALSRQNGGTLQHVVPKAVLTIDQDGIYAAYNIDPTIYRFSREAGVVDSFHVDLPHFKYPEDRPFVRSESHFAEYYSDYTFVRRIFKSGAQIFIVSVDYDPVKKAPLYHLSAYDLDKKQVGTTLETEFEPLCIDEHGQIYFAQAREEGYVIKVQTF